MICYTLFLQYPSLDNLNIDRENIENRTPECLDRWVLFIWRAFTQRSTAFPPIEKLITLRYVFILFYILASISVIVISHNCLFSRIKCCVIDCIDLPSTTNKQNIVNVCTSFCICLQFLEKYIYF